MAIQVTFQGIVEIAEAIATQRYHSAVGTGTNPTTLNQTTLENETNRTSTTYGVNLGDSVQIRALHLNADLPPTINEVGLFKDATDSLNTGVLVARAVRTFNKGTSDWTLAWEIGIEVVVVDVE